MPIRKTHEQFVKEIEARYRGEYIVVGEYKGTHTPIEMLHTVCGLKWNTTAPYDLLKPKSNTCPKCASNQSWKNTLDDLQKKVDTLYNKEYVVSGEYVNNKTHVTVTHKKCGRQHQVRPDRLSYGKYRCTYCNSPKSSVVSENVEKILTELELKFEKEKSFTWLKHEGALFLDFFISDYGIAIEADGEQHYIPKRGGSVEFEKTMIRDRAKVQLCKKHGIVVIRIPSWFAPYQLKPFLIKMLFENNVLDF